MNNQYLRIFALGLAMAVSSCSNNDDLGFGEETPTEDANLTGNLTEDGNNKRIAMIEDVMPDGRTIRDIYVNVGRLWDNNNDNPNAPQFTGLCETSNGEKRIAAWVKETERGRKTGTMGQWENGKKL